MSKNIKIVVCGYKGRMGKLILEVIDESMNCEFVGGVDIEDDLEKIIDNCDVIIDFSSPESSVQNSKLAAAHKKPIVIGTTGLTDEQNKTIESFASEMPILKSTNMSLGVNMMWKLAEIASKTLPWKTSISETHHIHKKDHPSGTALTLAEKVKCNRKLVIFEESFPEKEQPEDELWICSIREGEVVGDHDLILRSDEEELIISHRAFDRKVFARGAVKAASWLKNKTPGIYKMSEVIEN